MTVTLLDDVEVKLIAHTGDDRSIIAAAKVSTQGADSLDSLEQEAKEGLINYLMRNRHGTPFEHAAMTFFIKAPIFVFREFHRHRIGWSYNEESARYKQLEPEFYAPAFYRPGQMQQPGGKPGQYEYLDASRSEHEFLVDQLHDVYHHAYTCYERMLSRGVAKEVARMCLPVGIFSSMYATCNPRSLMAFLSLRTKDTRAHYPSKPQWEINRVASLMELEFQRLFPTTYATYCANGRVAP